MPTASQAALHGPHVGRGATRSDRFTQNRRSTHRARKALVSRTRLVRRLVATADRPVVLIVAPAGYGKSSVLREWSERDRRPFVWLAPQELSAETAKRRRGFTQRSSFVVAIDDAHLADPAGLHEFVESLLPRLPEGSTLALSSRQELDIPTGRLRAHRALLEVRADQLAMTPAEAAVLLRRGGLSLDFESVQALARRTEGWATGLYLATLSLREESDDHASVGSFGGQDQLVAEYFRDEVLSGTSSELLAFELQCSVLDELSGPLCDAILGRRGSAQMLAWAARENQFLRPVDAAHERYRFHALLRQTLERELWRTDPELAARLHARACGWLYEHGDVERAIAHAVAADDPGRTGEILWAHLAQLVTRGKSAEIQRWLGGLRETQVARSRPLALAAGHSALAMGDADEAQRWRLAAAAALETTNAPDDTPSLAAGSALLDAMTARTGLAAMLDCATRAYRLASEASPWRPPAGLVRGVALYLNGDSDGAGELLEESAALAGTVEPSITSLSLAHRAIIAAERGDWDAAEDLAGTAVETLEAHELGEQPISAIVFAAGAVAQARAGRPDEAKQNLRKATLLLADLGGFVPWYGALTRILLAHASLWLADIVRARTLLAEASRLARRVPDAVVFGRWFDEAWAHIDTLAETSLVGPSALTIAELRILRFLPSHRSFREIGSQLGVSANTVKTQAHAVYRKLGAASRSEAVTRAREAGLLAS